MCFFPQYRLEACSAWPPLGTRSASNVLQRDSELGTKLSDHSLQVIFSGYATRPKDGVPCPELSPLDARPVVGPGGSQEGECDCQVHFSGLRRSHRATETDSCFRLSSEKEPLLWGRLVIQTFERLFPDAPKPILATERSFCSIWWFLNIVRLARFRAAPNSIIAVVLIIFHIFNEMGRTEKFSNFRKL